MRMLPSSKTYARAVTDLRRQWKKHVAAGLKSAAIKMFVSSGRSMNEPLGSIILRTSRDWLSSHATRIAESRDRAARD
jgi:hypothetical protein